MKIIADFTRSIGRMKPMHGIGQPPMMGLSNRLMHYLREAGIPSSRLHDVQGYLGGGLYVDIPNLFPDFEADETLPQNYDFTFTDRLIAELFQQECEPFFRLGVTIENYADVKAYRVFPPKDYGKWARICEHVIRHYREGWAEGFHHPITYWEIWNEPDGAFLKQEGEHTSPMWRGEPEEFYKFYAIAAKHLKACFGEAIKVGGYAASGFFRHDEIDPKCQGLSRPPTNLEEACIRFAHEFLQYIRRAGAPLDFFSWHSYGLPESVVSNARYCRRLLEHYGYGKTEDILDEWNVWPDLAHRDTAQAAAANFGMMLRMQRERTSLMHFYDARVNSCSPYACVFNPATQTPYRNYYALKMFNDAYRLGTEVFASTEDEASVPACGATDGRRCALLVANMGESAIPAVFELTGADESELQVFMTNQEYWHTETGKRLDAEHRLEIPPYTCLELRLPRAR